MKKKLLSILIAVCMAVWVVPLGVFATTPEVTVNGVNLVSESSHTTNCGKGTAKYDPKNKLLTLTNAEIDNWRTGTNKAGIYIDGFGEDEFTIKLVGENSITLTNEKFEKQNVPEAQRNGLGIFKSGDGTLNLIGDGSLTVVTYSYNGKGSTASPHGIRNDGEIYIKDVTLDFSLESNSRFYGGVIETDNGDITFDNAHLTAKDYNDGIFVWYNDIEIKNNSVIDISSPEYCIYSEKDIIVSNGSELILNSDSDDEDCSIVCWGTVTVDNSKVTATSNSYNAINTANMSVKNNSVVKATSNTSNSVFVFGGILEIDNSIFEAKSPDGVKAVVARQRIDSPKADVPTEQDALIILGNNTGDINSSTIKTTEWEYVTFEEWDQTYQMWQRLAYFVDEKGENASNVIIDTLYPVTYNAGKDGNGDTKTVNKVKADDLTLENVLFTRDGYTQTGWATEDGGKKVYELGAKYTVDKAITLYPVWEKNTTTDNKDNNGKNDNVSDKNNANVDKNTTSPKTSDSTPLAIVFATATILFVTVTIKNKNKFLLKDNQ